MSIRKATPSDIPWISQQSESFIKSLGYAHAYLSDESVRSAIIECLVNEHLVLLAENEHGLVGMIGGEYCVHPYNTNLRTLYEHFWWVVPEKRGTLYGGKLLLEFIKIGKATADLVRVSLEYNSGISDESMLKRGLRLSEKTYIMENVK